MYLFLAVLLFSYMLLFNYTSYVSAHQGSKYRYVLMKKDNDFATIITTANTTNTPISSPNETIVSIVPDSAEMGEKGFSPNPVHIKVGDMVIWKNNDYDVHTVTEGSEMGGEPEDGFESGVLKPSQAFNNTFTNPSTIGYHCMLHPTMLGTIIVSP